MTDFMNGHCYVAKQILRQYFINNFTFYNYNNNDDVEMLITFTFKIIFLQKLSIFQYHFNTYKISLL